MTNLYDYDILVVGCGVAGTAAALSAAETAKKNNEDLNIAILERSKFEERGGNSRWTAAYMRMKSANEIADNFVDDMLKFSDNYSDRKYIEKLAENAAPTLQWLQEKGVEFDYLPTMFITSSKPRLLPVGGGRAIIDTLTRKASVLGVDIIYESTAWKVELNDEGEVEQVYIRVADSSIVKLKVKALILASGGFQGNQEMMSRYIGRDAHKIRPVCDGGHFDKGEGIQLALNLGAKPAGQYDAFHAEPVDPRSKREEAAVMAYPYGILVNKNGERFVDEGSTTIDEQYEEVARKIFYDQPDHIAYMIIDKKLYDIPNYERTLETDKPPIVADTIGELCEKLNLPYEKVKDTLDSYNAAVQPGEFKPLEKDGKMALGINPIKSNWANQINEAPFIAYPIVCSNVFTNGGLATDTSARVLSQDDVIIPGLYAAGEVAGLYYGKYTGGTSVLRGIVYGKIAGEHAVNYVKGKVLS